MDRAGLLDLVMNCKKRAEVEFDNRGYICVTTWKESGKIDDVWSSYNYASLQEFFETVKKELK